jgi:tryptophan halogenase
LIASNGFVYPIQVDFFNRIVEQNWIIIRDFLAIHYKFNTRKQTPFWQTCWEDVDLGEIQPVIEYYQAVGPDFKMLFHDFKRNIFTTEGYLAMLVGQQVPYRRTVSISAEEQRRWSAHKNRIKRMASSGMDMSTCLAHLRKFGLAGPQGDRGCEWDNY